MTRRLENKVALITGAASGIGREASIEYATAQIRINALCSDATSFITGQTLTLDGGLVAR